MPVTSPSLPRRALLASLPTLTCCANPPARPLALGTASVQVVCRDWHTDIALPASALPGAWGNDLRQRFPGAQTLVFGFGDRAHVGNRHPSLASMAQALFPGPGAMLVTALSTADANAAFGPGSSIHLAISPAQASAITTYVRDSFTLHPDGTPGFLGNGPYPGGVHFAGSRTYSGHFTCNTWTAAALEAGNLPVNSRGVLLASQVLQQLG